MEHETVALRKRDKNDSVDSLVRRVKSLIAEYGLVSTTEILNCESYDVAAYSFRRGRGEVVVSVRYVCNDRKVIRAPIYVRNPKGKFHGSMKKKFRTPVFVEIRWEGKGMDDFAENLGDDLRKLSA